MEWSSYRDLHPPDLEGVQKMPSEDDSELLSCLYEEQVDLRPGEESTVVYRLSTPSGRQVAQYSDVDGHLLRRVIRRCLRAFLALDVEVIDRRRLS